MTNIELYINRKLCDTDDAFGVRLNRQLLSPGELNTKDAQYSYSITLPPTSNNLNVFNLAGIEETKDKFNREYSAELIINGVRVFSGNFRLSEVSDTQYKGNLYVPAQKSVKDVFGGIKLSEIPEYYIKFGDFAEYISQYNTLARSGPQAAIFPYVLYGLLPKVPISEDNYSDRNVWDDSVLTGITDFSPSINVLLLLKHIFKSKGYDLYGSAFSDKRLSGIYMSYRNAADYEQPWNYGELAKIHISGSWSNRYNRNEAGDTQQLERGVYETYGDDEELYACNLFDCTNAKINIISDPGKNVSNVRRSLSGRDWYLSQIRIPASGYYKIRLNANVQLENVQWTGYDDTTKVRFIGAYGPTCGLTGIKTAIKLLRDWGTGDFNIGGSEMDGTLYRDNLPQDSNTLPRYYPYYDSESGMINFVDKAQNKNYLCGFQWGKKTDKDVNPLDSSTGLAQINVGKPAFSWDSSLSRTEISRIAINNPNGYMKYGVPDEGGTERPVWTSTTKFISDLKNSPRNYARRGFFEGSAANKNYSADGVLNCVAWLNAGELLTLADVSNKGVIIDLRGVRGWVSKKVTFDLEITPFRKNEDWLKIDETGTGRAAMDWSDPVNFDINRINLTGFLPADVKTDDFIENFCKAFNLRLSQVDDKAFSLDVKQTKATSNLYINLDNLTSTHDRSNLPLGLPSRYKLGFTVDTEEEGYIASGEDDGGGEFKTGVAEEKTVEQKSNFSYNWFKDIIKRQQNKDIIIPLPVISKHEVWTNELSYPEAMLKRYTDLPVRFWYYDGLLNDLGAEFTFNGRKLSVAKVSNELAGMSILNYKNKRLTILDNFFTILINGSSHYTEVEGYLTAEQYEAFNGVIMAMFNGDIYYVAELSGYDPTGRNKTKIKLIRKI